MSALTADPPTMMIPTALGRGSRRRTLLLIPHRMSSQWIWCANCSDVVA